MNEGFRFKCRVCSEWHEGLPDLGFDAPFHYHQLSNEERERIATKSSDLCTIDDEDVFVRGVVERTSLTDVLAGEPKRRGFKKGIFTTLSYLVAHESHHRGNILLTLKTSGHKLDKDATYAIWDWDKI